jgi:predicted nuclease with TOPRIM domain
MTRTTLTEDELWANAYQADAKSRQGVDTATTMLVGRAALNELVDEKSRLEGQVDELVDHKFRLLDRVDELQARVDELEAWISEVKADPDFAKE